MDQPYPPNSRVAAEEQQATRKAEEPLEVKQITTAEVRQRKVPLGRRFKQTFFSGDARTTVSVVFTDIIIPQAKDLLVDSVTTTFEKMVRGETYHPGPRRSRGGSVIGGQPGRVDYQGLSNPAQAPRPQMSQVARQTHDFGQIELQTYADASAVMEAMYTIFSHYETVTVYDLYGLIGENRSGVDRNWGWRDLRDCGQPRRTRNQTYVLDLPRPTPL